MKTASRTRLGIAVGCVVAVAFGAGAAHAVFTPAWSYVPVPVRAHLAKQLGGSIFLPARTPLFYRYRGGAHVSNGVLSVTFTNRVRVHQGLWRWTKKTFLWQARKLPAATSCAAWAARTQTFQVDGNKVFGSDSASPPVAWRCLTNPHGTYVLSATQGDEFNALALALVVASGLDVSRR